MEKDKIKQFILTQRQNGIPDDQIYSFLKNKGVDLTVEQPQKPITEKILDFTGGKELAQGLGQALAQGATSKEIQKTQESQIGIQSELLNKIKEKKSNGEDTTRLENALNLITEDIQKTGQGAEKLLNPNELTRGKVIGDALQLGTTVGTIGGLSGAGAKATGALGKIPGLTKQGTGVVTQLADKVTKGGIGVLSGAGKGAIIGGGTGIVSGGLTGISQGLQEGKSIDEIGKAGLRGSLIGGITGGVLGGVVGGISGGIKQAKLSKADSYLKAITPDTKDLTPTEYEELLNKGKITPKTSTKPAQYILSDGEKNIAKKYKDIFTNDPVKNTERIMDKIAQKDKEVGNFLKQNNGIFNTGELRNSISSKLENVDDLLVSDEKLTKAKTSIVDNFIKSLKKNDMESLWKARKEFDRQIEKAFTGSPTLQNTIKKEFRNAVQDFISERTPNNIYKTAMKDMSELFNLKEITNTKAVKEKGMNAIQLWVKRHPTRVKVIGATAGTGILTGIGASLVKN